MKLLDVSIYLGTTPINEGWLGTIKVYPPSQQPVSSFTGLKLTALTSGSLSWSSTAPKQEYSLDDGQTWTEYSVAGSSISLSAGQSICWRRYNATSAIAKKIGQFTLSSGTWQVSGNVMSLLSTNYENMTDLTGWGATSNGIFQDLFKNCTNLISITGLVLPATTLAVNCYYDMFYGCTRLTTAPALPATTLAKHCYSEMFYGCTSLTVAPALPATTLADNCYSEMFYGCTSLTVAPALPATTLTDNCYYMMFNGCTGLTTAPALPATTLAVYCYFYMFSGCTGLTTAPTLPATTLQSLCYNSMFYGCTSLTTAPVLPATTLVDYCYSNMFAGCTSLNYIKCLATDISATQCTLSWLSLVSSSGTFVKSSTMTSWTSGADGIPTNWTVQDA